MSILHSQVGYDLGEANRIVVCADKYDPLLQSASLVLSRAEGATTLNTPLVYRGRQWGRHWWIADIAECRSPGTYMARITMGGETLAVGGAFQVGRDQLWEACYPVICFEHLDTRAEQAASGKGWRDCGSDLQELSSHVVALDAICDLLETPGLELDASGRSQLLRHLVTGIEYVILLQDRASELGLGDGPVVHEFRQDHVVTGNVAKAAMILARVGRVLRGTEPELARDCLSRAEQAFEWISAHGPIVNEEEPIFFPPVHGAPEGSGPPPDQWMTRDLVMMARAAVELHKAGLSSYQGHGIDYADRVMARQVPRASAEGGLWGHFYTYDDYEQYGGARFAEKANIHCGAWSRDGRIYNKGGHYPHYLLPLVDMLGLWPEHPRATEWRRCLEQFVEGYLIPAMETSPFEVLPAGCFSGEGLLHFSGWYHAHNGMYALAASLALELYSVLHRPRLRELAVANLQWVAGLNAGVPDSESAGRYVPVSMITGVGREHRGGWTGIPGTICNGFAATPQFTVEPPRAETDVPAHLHDEGYIAHSLPFVAALGRLRASR
jgi:hypothetical protein